jgi:membrane protease YdiL (CAAX protease family)
MPEWATFVGFAFVVTAGLLLLSHASRGVVADGGEAVDGADPVEEPGDPTSRSAVDGFGSPDADDADRRDSRAVDDGPCAPGAARSEGAAGDVDASESTTAATRGGGDPDSERFVLPKSGVAYRPAEPRARPHHPEDGSESPSTTSLLANVAVSQGLFGALLLVGAWYAEIPAQAFGAGPGTTGVAAVAAGVGLGVGLYLANEAGAAVGSRFGLDVGDGQRLRGALAPDTRLGWALLLLVVLPVIAGFEEVLFRGALVGVVAAGYDVSPWVLAVVASGAFALGHGAQGRLGVVVTGALGLVLAAAFVVTGSLLTVIVAHYLVNALEFVVHEGLGIEWPPDPA